LITTAYEAQIESRRPNEKPVSPNHDQSVFFLFSLKSSSAKLAIIEPLERLEGKELSEEGVAEFNDFSSRYPVIMIFSPGAACSYLYYF